MLRARSLTAGGCAAVAGLLACAVWYLKADGLPDSTPRCSWPVRVTGSATPEQAGLVRCYLKGVAQRDLAALRSLALPGPDLRIGASQLVHSADARRGTATAVFAPNPSDSAYFTVTIMYTDGTREGFPMELANPASAHSWRLAIGSYHAAKQRAQPPPAGPSPGRQQGAR